MRRPASGVRLAGRRFGVFLGCALVLGATPSAAQKASDPGRRTPDAEATRTQPRVAACPAEPGVRSICFSRIEAEYSILRSGDVLVTQTQTIRFNGSWNGMTWGIREEATPHDDRPMDEVAARPRTDMRHVPIAVLGAIDDAGNPLRVEEERNGWDLSLRIWVPNATDAERTITLRYRIEDGVTFFAEHDEFYWDVVGTESTSPIGEIEVRIIPPQGATGLRADAASGVADAYAGNVDASVQDGMIVARTTAPIQPGAGFSVAAAWDAGLVERPGPLQRALAWLARYWSFALPLLALRLMWSLWHRRGRDPDTLPTVVRYEPPEGLTPGEVGTLLDEGADLRDVTATLVDLAVQGRLRIEEIQGTKVFGMEFGEDYKFVQTTPPGSARQTKWHEQKLLNALFTGRSEVELSDLRNSFYKHLPDIREAMMGALTSHGVYTTRPDRVRAAWLAGGAVVGVALFFLLGFLPTTAPGAMFMVPILTALPVMVFGYLMPARTVAGARLIEMLGGFREFLERVDGDRLRRMSIDPSTFEKLLPYAMAFGVEKRWAQAFEGLADQPPNWYRSRHGGPFRPVSFANSLSRMSTTAASTMTSQPKSSSGGGGSGFSGGGGVRVGGGGGGGRFGGF